MATTYPDWVLELDDSRLLAHFDPETLRRGRTYAQQSRVGRVSVASGIVAAQVRGSGHQNYYTSVALPRGIESLVASCSCPMRQDCKHAVALILHMRQGMTQARTPQWQQTLDPVVGRAARSRSGETLGLQFNRSPNGYWLRPLKRGARDNWVKTGAEWEDLRFGFGGRLDPTQREPLARLLGTRRQDPYGYASSRVTQLYLSDLTPGSWVELRRALQSGVDFLPGEDAQRRPLPPISVLDEQLEPVVVIDRSAQGGVSVATKIMLGDRELAVPPEAYVGRPAHGAVVEDDGRLLIGGLTRALDEAEHELFTGEGAVEVPESDVALFASGFLPKLRDKFDVHVHEGVVLPELQPPTVLCRVEFGVRNARVEWGFRYQVGDRAHDLPAVPSADDPPLRDEAAESELAESLPPGPWRTPGPGGRVQLGAVVLTGRELIDFVGRVLPELQERDDVEVVLNEPPPDFHEAEEAPTVTLRVSDPQVGDWFNLGVEITVGDERVPFEALFRALSVGDDHLVLDSGTWFSLERPELDQLRAVIEEARGIVDHEGDTFRLRPEHAGLWEELVELGVVADQSAAWREAVVALLDVESLPAIAAPEGLNAELRPYQDTGLRWLGLLWRTRLGGILADEMGLGKTVQALALAQSAQERGELDAPLLVVAPTSVVATWSAEAEKFTPDLRVVTIGQTEKRRGAPLAESVGDAQVVLTSYTLLRMEAEAYQDLEWSAVLLDEAQFVKNSGSKAYQAVRKLRARTKIALTGTPLENNLMDLWSLLSITAPGLFSDPKKFAEVYRKPIENGDADTLARLHRRIRPLILRRTKSAVATELPEKQEQIVPVTLAPAHRRLYDKHLARERQKVLGLVGDMRRNRITILRSLTLLRQLSLAPVLINQDYPVQSAKIDILVELLSEVTAEGHRALVFSQFTGFLGLVRTRLAEEGITTEYLDGRTRDRAERIKAFREGDADAFLISLKAGGFGLTLTEADYVFILDPWWNPAAETQAIDRTHRIGQDKPVNVYRLVSADTIEESVVALQEKKRHLFDAVVGQASDMAAPLSADDIRGLLEI